VISSGVVLDEMQLLDIEYFIAKLSFFYSELLSIKLVNGHLDSKCVQKIAELW